MQEILFKAKRVDNGKWAEGYYREWEDLYRNIISEIMVNTDEHGNFVSYKVIPETVSQFTGLTDKNGIKVFENDIFKEKEDETYKINNHVVYWNKETGQWCQRCNCKYTSGSSLWLSSKRCEVIGNIFDNPELLER